MEKIIIILIERKFKAVKSSLSCGDEMVTAQVNAVVNGLIGYDPVRSSCFQILMIWIKHLKPFESQGEFSATGLGGYVDYIFKRFGREIRHSLITG